MLFASVVFTTFLVAVFSVALFCATGLSPVTAGLVAGFAVAEAAASWTHHCHCPDIAVFLHKLKGAQGRGKPAQMQPAV